MKIDLNQTPDYTAGVEAVSSEVSQLTTVMSNSAAAQSVRSARLSGILTRLQKNSKTPAATLQRLQQRVSAADTSSKIIAPLAARVAARPAVDGSDISLFGHVTDATGAPAAGVYARLTDTAGKVNAGTRVKTDGAGDFSLVLKACELPAGTSALLVSVENSGGTRFGASGSVTPTERRPLYLEISLPAAPAKG